MLQFSFYGYYISRLGNRPSLAGRPDDGMALLSLFLAGQCRSWTLHQRRAFFSVPIASHLWASPVLHPHAICSCLKDLPELKLYVGHWKTITLDLCLPINSKVISTFT